MRLNGKHLVRVIPGTLALFLLAGCGTERAPTTAQADTPAGDPVAARVIISPNHDSGVVGSSLRFTAVVKDSAGATLPAEDLTWESSDTTIAVVDNAGVATYLAPGASFIYVRRGHKRDSSTVNVTPAPVASVVISPTSLGIRNHTSRQLAAVAYDATGKQLTERAITWTTSNSTIATVSATGLVSGTGVGTAAITATSEGKVGVGNITVTDAPVVSVIVTPAAASIQVNSAVQLSSSATDSLGLAVTRARTWSSLNPEAASVSSNGLVSGLNAATARIVATLDGKADTSVITITAPSAPQPPTVASVGVTPASSSLLIGATAQLSATPKDASGNVISGQTITWSSSNGAVAAVSTSGTVTAVAAGSATITATTGGKSGTAGIAVTAPLPPSVATVSVSPASASLYVGGTQQLGAVARDSANNVLTGRTFSWTSSSTAIATVSSSGLVTAVATGSATITASTGGKSGTSAITVMSQTPPPPPPPSQPPPGGFATPNVLNNESFESGWGLFDNGGGSAPTGVTRDQTRASDGATAVRRAFSPNSGDVGSGFTLPFYYKGPASTYDRVWVRFSFFMDRVPTSAFKFVLFWSGGFSDDFGGLYIHNGRDLTWSFLNEWSGGSARLADATSLVGGWHTVEMDFWRNGDPSGNPSVAIWLDGQQITSGGTAGTGRWINGRLDAGSRSAGYGNRQLGALRPMSTLNGGNTATGSVWMDRIAVSSVGRIGP